MSSTFHGESSVLDPASPSPGRGKRPQAIQEVRAVQKKLKFDKEVALHVLLPNGKSVTFTADAARIRSVNVLLDLVKANAVDAEQDGESSSSRSVEWGHQVWLEDRIGNRFSDDNLPAALSSVKSAGSLLLILQDGHPKSSHMDRNMWNVTPKPEMLGQLPQGYTLETALADQVDNALQAVWHGPKDSRRLVSVNLSRDKITIFDTGQGMDATDENSIANWGTVGGSTHRSVHHKAIGGEPPFLKPYLGKYGAGGVASALHLGSVVTVWSKTKQSKLVTSLGLEQKALVEKHREDPQQRVWRTQGTFRRMTKVEEEMAPHGSFTRVEISKLKAQYCVAEDQQQYWRVDQIRGLMKDIYFPYIQSESGSRTVFPVEFQVNGENLLGVTACEMAISQMHTCTGQPFIFDIRFTKGVEERDKEELRVTRLKTNVAEEANARITCRYYPNQKGKEALETVLEEFAKIRPRNSMTFETMHRVTIRWLGRLLPEVRWPMLYFMEIAPRKEEKLGVRRLWSKRVRAFVDTDAGFHPNQSKTELERDQPFAVALKQTGCGSFTGSSALGVVVTVKHEGRDVSVSNLADAYVKWLKLMHENYDEDFTFVDQPIYIFNHPNAHKELGVVQNKIVILLHKHMKDSKGEWKVDNGSPLHIRLPRGANGSKSELYATVEYFFHDGAEDEHGDVKFLCRALEVKDTEGCKVIQEPQRARFQLNKSQWFRASLLTTAKRVDAITWKKKFEELSNKSPSHVQILTEQDVEMLELCEVFPADKSRLEAGFTLPKELAAVVRPKKGSGQSYKQGMIVAEALDIILTIVHCRCRGPCLKKRASDGSRQVASAPVADGHAKVVCKLAAQICDSKTGVKGVYMFNIGSSEVNRLVMQGTYTFCISVEGDKSRNVAPAELSIHILPSRVTGKWTLCKHSEDCTVFDHDKQPTQILIRINELVKDDLFVQRYDEFDNRQNFENFEVPMELDVMVVTPHGESLNMQTKAHTQLIRSTQRKQRLQIKDLCFTSGLLEEVERKHEAVLRVHFSNDQHAEISCKVLPGELASIQVKDSRPLVSPSSLCFKEAFRPGETIKILTLQGLDAFGNKIEKGQKMQVQLESLEFQDNLGTYREADGYGCLQLGGLLKVTCHYNSTGSISIVSGIGSKLCTINFRTVTRQLIATQVPQKAYVGRQLQGIFVTIIDENGDVDPEVDGYCHSVSMDWQNGVTCPFTRGKCMLPSIRLPDKPGCWKGNVKLSADPTLSITLMVELEMATACSISHAQGRSEVLMVKSGVPFIFPFSVYDDQQKPAVLTESMKQNISGTAKARKLEDESDHIFRPCTVMCMGVKMSRNIDLPIYEARIVVSGPIGLYDITLLDTSFEVKGRAQASCHLQHGKLARLVPTLSNGMYFQEPEHHIPGPVDTVEATRCSPIPGLMVTLLDLEDNVCSDDKGRKLLMRIQNCPEWKVLVTQVSRGIGQFESSLLLIPVGSYVVSIELDTSLDDFYNLDEDPQPGSAHFSLNVSHGNYPAALSFISSKTICVSLTEESVQYLPEVHILVESADGKRLQSRPTVGVKIHHDQSVESVPKEYIGTFIERCELEMMSSFYPEDEFSTNEQVMESISPIAYAFAQVCAPSQAGTYVMEFFVRGCEVPSIIQHLIVKHGPPSRLEIIPKKPGQEMDNLKVILVDAHGNVCEEVSGLEICLELGLSRNFKVISVTNQCAILSKTTTIVEGGEGEFEALEMSQGDPGMYTLKVFAREDDSFLNQKPLISAEVQIFVTKWNVSETVQEQYLQTNNIVQVYKGCLKGIKMGEAKIREKKAARMALEENIRKLEGEIRFQEGQRSAVRELQDTANDEEILRAEQSWYVRTKQDVINDISCDRKGNSAARTLLEAQSQNNFLSPQSTHPAATDVLGLVVMLARVESESLNSVLSEYMGYNSLLLIVSRTQQGIDALEGYDANNVVDESKGLHGFARSRGYEMSGNFDGLALMDARTYWRSDGRPPVNMNHPQRTLNIDPPLLPNGTVPVGFLGYAVNLIHIRSEHLQMRIVTRHGDVGLRESLFFHLLAYLQVYDTRQNIMAAKTGLRKFTGAISLDGRVISRDLRQRLGKRSDKLRIRFSMVPPEERMMGGLLPPACHAFQRLSEVNSFNGEIKSKQESLGSMRQMQNNLILETQHLEQVVNKTSTEQMLLSEKSRCMRSQVEELMRVADTIEARNSGSSMSGNSSNFVSSRSDKMRAFLI